MRVARVWTQHGLKPHRLERYLASDDPDFETKAADAIGLYLHPPQHAAVFSSGGEPYGREKAQGFRRIPIMAWAWRSARSLAGRS